jgi:ketosteroid isomerase-like protein
VRSSEASKILRISSSAPSRSSGKSIVPIEVAEIEGTATMAWSRGTYKLTMMIPGAEPMADHGKFLEIWAKQADGSWKVKHDIFNSDLPLPAPPVKSEK